MTISQMFYEDAVRYFKSANIVSNSYNRDIDDELLLTPILYLLRHSVELIIKALILKFVEQSNSDVDVSQFKPCFENGVKSSKRLLENHSIGELFSFLRYFDKNNRLCSMFDDSELKFANKVVRNINNIDAKSDYFRYPIGKNNKRNKRHFVSMSNDDLAPEINKGYFLFLFGDSSENKVIPFTADEKYIKLADEMGSLANMLMTKY